MTIIISRSHNKQLCVVPSSSLSAACSLQDERRNMIWQLLSWSCNWCVLPQQTLWYYQNRLQRAATCQPESITWISSVWVTLPVNAPRFRKTVKDQRRLNLEPRRQAHSACCREKGILGQIEMWDVKGTLHKTIRVSMCVYVCVCVCVLLSVGVI